MKRYVDREEFIRMLCDTIDYFVMTQDDGKEFSPMCFCELRLSQTAKYDTGIVKYIWKKLNKIEYDEVYNGR